MSTSRVSRLREHERVEAAALERYRREKRRVERRAVREFFKPPPPDPPPPRVERFRRRT